MLLLSLSLASLGCELEAPDAASPAPDTPSADAAGTTVAEERRGYEIPIPQVEYWDDARTILKFTYEMRFDPPGPGEKGPRLHRNGWARAYYGSGALEREGSYRYVPELGRSERVGVWTYYEPDGSVSRREDRGGDPIWTRADQRTAPPGTDASGDPE
ncbi:MAG: hypothetical protein VXX86_03240 [Planctomycetota bacterium]|nr:hypothetical protein [Planctomycetota bacterium]